MLSVALKGLEAAMNRVLRLDPDTLARLEKLDKKIIKVSINDWRIDLFMSPYNNGVHLNLECDDKPSTIISGNLFDLIRVGQAGGSGSSLFKNDIKIEGDVGTGEIIRDLMRDIDIDWEEHLSHFVGDSLAHGVMRGLRGAIGVVQHATASLRDNTSEYLIEEARHIPSKNELEEFYQGVSDIRDDVERLEARINVLLN